MNQHLDSSTTSSLRGSNATEAIQNRNVDCHESLRDSRNDEILNYHYFVLAKSRNDGIRFAPKFYFILGIIFNLCLLGFFKYTDFLLENFNAFSKLAHLDFDIPLPHILLPLALSFVTFQQIAFLFDCYKRTKGELDENLHIDFIDYALFISFFPQLIAGPIVHHREMMPQFAKMGANSACGDFSQSASAHSLQRTPSASHSFASHNHENSLTILEFASCNGIVKNDKNNPSLRGSVSEANTTKQSINNANQKNRLPRLDFVKSRNDELKSTINYEFLAKGIFIFSIGLFKKAFIADSFAKWANAGFSVVESGGMLNIAESWATSLSYTFQLYFDFSGYCDMAIGLALMFGIVLPLNFDSPYKSLNISEFWRRWHITLGRFLKECAYIPLGGNRASKILNLRNLFIVAFLSGIWHGAGWGFVIWGVLHGVAMMIHRIYSWILERLTKSIMCRHTEQSEGEVSKSRESQINNESMTKQRINESHKFTQSKKIANDSQVAKIDCFDLTSSSLAKQGEAEVSLVMTSGNSSLQGDLDTTSSLLGSVSEANTTKQSINSTTPSLRENPQGFSWQSTNTNNIDCHESLRASRNDEKMTKFLKSRNDGLFIRFTQTCFYKVLCWFITFNFVNIAWIFFRAENLNVAVNLIKGMFGFASSEIPHKWSKIFSTLQGRTNEIIIWIVCAVVVCLMFKNSNQITQNIKISHCIIAGFMFALLIFTMLSNTTYKAPFLYFNF